jgi:hypothetical protein
MTTKTLLVDKLWRPLASATLMLVIGSWIHARWLTPAGLGQDLAGLAILVVIGAAIYIAAVGGFWWLARRPRGAESTLVALIKVRLSGSA